VRTTLPLRQGSPSSIIMMSCKKKLVQVKVDGI